MTDQTETAADAVEMPAWFDAETHRTGEGGIFERATGVLLGEDGQPASAAVRASRAFAAAEAEAEAAAAEAAAAAAAAPKTRRDTRQIVEAAAVAAAEKE